MSQNSTGTETLSTEICRDPKCDCHYFEALWAADCVVLDGKCDCERNPDGGIPDECKYLTQEEK